MLNMNSKGTKMRCYICDVVLHPTEINYNDTHHKFDPCSRCKEATKLVDFDVDTHATEEYKVLIDDIPEDDV